MFVEAVDVVCGVGYDRAARLSEADRRFHEIRRVVTNLGVLANVRWDLFWPAVLIALGLLLLLRRR